MSTQLSNSFVRQYEEDVHHDFQRMGSLIRNTVRTVNGVVGTSTTFQRIGTGTAVQKSAINGVIAPMSIDHTPVVCTLQDWYAPDLVDKLDENKINYDERQAIVRSGAYALGRRTDQLLIDALDGSSNFGTTGALDIDSLYEGWETLAENDALQGGRLYAFVGPKQWTAMLAIEQFSSSDYVGTNDLPFVAPGIQGKFFMNTLFMTHTGLTLDTAERQCPWYNEIAVGHAIGEDVSVDIDWDGERQAHRITSKLSMGAVLIEDNGTFIIDATES